MSIETIEKLPPPQTSVVDAIEAGKELPVLDLGAFLAGDPAALQQLAGDVRAIQESLGFYTIVNFGFDPSIIELAHEQAQKLFALPESANLPFEYQDHMQGYWRAKSIVSVRPGYEGEAEEGSKLGGWTFLRERAPDDPKVLSNKRHRAMNKWPDPQLLPDFRPVMGRYQAEMVGLGLKLVKVYAVALGLPVDYFDRDFTDLEWYSRLNFAPGDKGAGETPAITPHSDHSFLTLLPISPVPGLQVRTPQQTWIDVAYRRDSIVVNTGEWLNQLTNGRFLATPHRVTKTAVDRISMPVFINPNDEAINDPVPGAVAPGDRSKFRRSNWHEFFLSYIDGYMKHISGS